MLCLYSIYIVNDVIAYNIHKVRSFIDDVKFADLVRPFTSQRPVHVFPRWWFRILLLNIVQVLTLSLCL